VIGLSGIDRRTFGSLPGVLSVEEMAEFLAVSINTAYALLRQKKVASVRVGRQYRLPRKSLAKFLGIDQDY
jgi:excisionase family DNA binding protein